MKPKLQTAVGVELNLDHLVGDSSCCVVVPRAQSQLQTSLKINFLIVVTSESCPTTLRSDYDNES